MVGCPRYLLFGAQGFNQQNPGNGIETLECLPLFLFLLCFNQQNPGNGIETYSQRTAVLVVEPSFNQQNPGNGIETLIAPESQAIAMCFSFNQQNPGNGIETAWNMAKRLYDKIGVSINRIPATGLKRHNELNSSLST